MFLYPEANIVLVKPLQAVIERLSPRIKERIHVVTVESVVQLLASDEATPPRLAWYVELLAEKYILRAHVS